MSIRNIKRLVKIVIYISLALLITLQPTLNVAHADSSNNVLYFGDSVPCGKDNGYIPNTSSKWNPCALITMPGLIASLIPKDNPHNGWELGKFFVKGFSAKTESDINYYSKNMVVFLKNVGDELSFGFNLKQDISRLNNTPSLFIEDDRKIIQDCWIQEPYYKADFHHGLLMILHTDFKGETKIIKYHDFLKAVQVGADTEVMLFEEGDYRLILCYEIYVKRSGFNWLLDWTDPNGTWYDYRMESYFSVRNGNCMAFPIELNSGSELMNNSVTQRGFRIDFAQSHYLNVIVKKENINANLSGLVVDTRFNGLVSDGSEFTDEGKYTITIQNQYTGITTQKIIYIGNDPIMKCNTVTGKSINEIKKLLAQGYQISKDGQIVSDASVNGEDNNVKTIDDETLSSWMIALIVILPLLVVVGTLVIFWLKRRV